MSRRITATIIGLGVFLGVWELFVRLAHVRPFVLRAPSTALAHLWRFRSGFASATWITVQHAVIGLAIALAVGLLVGGALSASRVVEHASQPVLVLVQVTPWFAYVGSVVLWLGSGTPPALFMVALVCVPAFVFATVDGMRGADPAALELFRSVDAGRWETLWRLRLPSAAPTLFTGARFNWGLALAASYYVEGANFSSRGLGAIGRSAAAQNESEAMWAAVFATAILGLVGLLALAALQRLVLRWHVSQRPGAR
jgi:NitT/TauT family transport system permease protein